MSLEGADEGPESRANSEDEIVSTGVSEIDARGVDSSAGRLLTREEADNEYVVEMEKTKQLKEKKAATVAKLVKKKQTRRKQLKKARKKPAEVKNEDTPEHKSQEESSGTEDNGEWHPVRDPELEKMFWKDATPKETKIGAEKKALERWEETAADDLQVEKELEEELMQNERTDEE